MNGAVGFEILTPLVLADGTAVIIDRGWLAPPGTAPRKHRRFQRNRQVEVTVVEGVHAPESRGTCPRALRGTLAVRRISPDQLAADLPYRLYGAYITLENQNPTADAAFVPIPPDHQNAAMNAGYVCSRGCSQGSRWRLRVPFVRERRNRRPTGSAEFGHIESDPDRQRA